MADTDAALTIGYGAIKVAFIVNDTKQPPRIVLSCSQSQFRRVDLTLDEFSQLIHDLEKSKIKVKNKIDLEGL